MTIAFPPSGCVFCNAEISQAIYNASFPYNLLTILSAFIVIAIIVFALWIISTRQHRHTSTLDPRVRTLNPVPLATASIVLGIGIGGLLDGVILHQILQWHEMLSNIVPANTYVGKSVNMFWDGVFHAFCILVTLVGVWMLWHAMRRLDADKSARLLFGGAILGWGLFNLVEGIIDHHILKLHNVQELSAEPEVGNLAFLIASAVLVLAGYTILRQKPKYRKRHKKRPPTGQPF